jgi:hypothetical protein
MTFMVIFSAIGPAFYSGVLWLTGNYKGGNLVSLIAALSLFACAFRVKNPQQSPAPNP